MPPVVELVARPVLTPSPVRVLDRSEPVHRPADLGRCPIHAGNVEGAEYRPSPVDIVNAPSTIPAAVWLLGAAQVVEAGRNCWALLRGFAELAQHRQAAGREIGARGIEQRPVIGERDIVEVVVGVIRVEGGPTTVLALQANDPF